MTERRGSVPRGRDGVEGPDAEPPGAGVGERARGPGQQAGRRDRQRGNRSGRRCRCCRRCDTRGQRAKAGERVVPFRGRHRGVRSERRRRRRSVVPLGPLRERPTAEKPPVAPAYRPTPVTAAVPALPQIPAERRGIVARSGNGCGPAAEAARAAGAVVTSVCGRCRRCRASGRGQSSTASAPVSWPNSVSSRPRRRCIIAGGSRRCRRAVGRDAGVPSCPSVAPIEAEAAKPRRRRRSCPSDRATPTMHAPRRPRASCPR